VHSGGALQVPRGAIMAPPFYHRRALCVFPGRCWIRTARVWAVPGIVVCNCKAHGAIEGAGSRQMLQNAIFKVLLFGKKAQENQTNELPVCSEGGGDYPDQGITRCGLTNWLIRQVALEPGSTAAAVADAPWLQQSLEAMISLNTLPKKFRCARHLCPSEQALHQPAGGRPAADRVGRSRHGEEHTGSLTFPDPLVVAEGKKRNPSLSKDMYRAFRLCRYCPDSAFCKACTVSWGSNGRRHLRFASFGSCTGKHGA
jgi:hypothetical protein